MTDLNNNASVGNQPENVYDNLEFDPTRTPTEAEQVRAQEQIQSLMNGTDTVSSQELERAMAELEPSKKAEETTEEMPEDEQPVAIDAKVVVSVLPGGLEAYIEVLAPSNGGAEASPRYIRRYLQEAGITYGIIDSVLFEMAMNKPYGKGRILVAKGKPKQDGRDAVVTEHFPREIAAVPFKNNDGTVNFKQLDIVREIKVGTTIVTMVPPTEGAEGMTVKGEVLKPIPGKPTSILKGNNTTLSEDGLKLISAVNGHLVYSLDRFNVESTYVVEGSIDNNTGNLCFCGDVLVKGEVREGYEIRSGGTVRVKGAVEGANIFAEKDIFMELGYNGMKHGEVSAKTGSINSKFLQNCTAYAKESIISETIINSIVDCDGTIVCTRSKGTIVGGKIAAMHSVEANTLGSDVNTPTSISVGLSPTIIAEKQKLEKEVKEVEDGKEALHKNLVYLERCAKMGPLSPKNLALVDTCNKQKVILMMREGKAARRLTEVNALIEEAATGSFVKAKVMYPSVKITIQNLSYVNKMVQNRALIRREDGDIRVSNY